MRDKKTTSEEQVNEWERWFFSRFVVPFLLVLALGFIVFCGPTWLGQGLVGGIGLLGTLSFIGYIYYLRAKKWFR